MYNTGQGIYNSTARSFYNVNPVYNPEDNGRASPQFPTQHVPIYNPAMTLEHMHTQAQASKDYLNQGGIVNYATRGMHAENYSLLQSQARAKQYGNLMGGLSTVSTVLGIAGGLFAGTGVGLGIGAGAMYLSNKLDSYQNYYKDYSNRMNKLSGIRNSFAGNYNIVNPATGIMSNQDANAFADMMQQSSLGSGFTEQDMYSIHTMANRSGMMLGHTGSLSKVTSRISSLAKMTKHIMDLGEGIDQSQAMEIQRLSQVMEVDLGKFKNLQISEKLINAAKLTNKTIAATTALVQSSASQATQMGLSGQTGAESALYHSRFAAPQFGQLTAKQQMAVGGSQDAYVQNLVGAQLNFASRNASALAMGAYYIDPSTGQFKIDTNEVYAMAHGGLDPNKEYKRGMQLLNKENRARLRTAGISQNLVSNLLQENLGSLGKQAMGAVSSDLQTAMSIQEILRFAADNNMSFNQAAGQLGYTSEQLASLQTFAQNYGKGHERQLEEDRVSYLQELSARNANSKFTHTSQRVKDQEKLSVQRQANLDATIDSMKADRAREEATGIYGGRRKTFSQDEINAVLSGGYSSIIEGRGVGLRTVGLNRHGVDLNNRDIRDMSSSDRILHRVMNPFDTLVEGGGGSIADTTAGKKVLARLYASDFFGEGSDVANEDYLGIDSRIMSRLAFGSSVSTNDLNSTFNARKTVMRALQEIYGRGSGKLEDQLQLIDDEKTRNRIRQLSTGDAEGNLTRSTAEELSRSLAALQVRESAKFSATGRRLRTAGGRQNILSSVEGDEARSRINQSAAALRKTIQAGVDSSSNFFATDNSEYAIQTSRRAMAQSIFRSGNSGFKSVEEVEANLDTILARAYESGGENVRKTLDKTFEISESAAALMGDRRKIYDADTVIGSYTTKKQVTEIVRNQPTASMIGGEVLYAEQPSSEVISYTKTLKNNVTLSQLALGSAEVKNGEEASKLIADKAMTLTNAVRKLSEKEEYKTPGKAQNAIADLIHRAAKYIIDQGGNDSDFEAKLGEYLYANEEHAKLLSSLDADSATAVKNFIKEKVNDQGAQDILTKTSTEEFRGMFQDLITVGKQEIESKAVESFVSGSSTAKGMFGGGTDKEIASRLIDSFRTLHDKSTFSDPSKFRSASGGIRTDAILKALGYDLSTMSKEDAAGIRNLAAEAFGSGTFDEESRKKFEQGITRRIQQGKMKSVGGGPNLSNADAIQSAVTGMLTLQQATAKLLTALATNDKGKLEEVATTLATLQSAKK